VRFREAVFAEAQNLLVDLPREGLRITACPMPSTRRVLEFLEAALAPPRAIERRRWSASPGVKPAATIASCITCSWKIGMPSVRSSTALTASLG
jgi:hypothetical protein